MREHMGLYKGKRKDNGEWVEGYLHVSRYKADAFCISFYPVYPDTIGECTGRKDKNGKLIFEGDILEVIRNKARWICVVEDVRNLPTTMFGSAVESIEIIGNIHDNKNLLSGQEVEE